MSTQTPNLNLNLREGTDIFNPLSTNDNFETLDSVITEIRKKGGVPTYTTTASANLLKLSENPVPNETLFKFVAAGDANTWSYQESVNKIVALNGKQKMIKGGEMYVAWVNAANAMVVIAWPDIVDAQTFNGKGPAEWASKAQLDAVNQKAENATTTAQAAATVANNALKTAQEAGLTAITAFSGPIAVGSPVNLTTPIPDDAKLIVLTEDQFGASMCGKKIGTFTMASFMPSDTTPRLQVQAYYFDVTKTTVTLYGAGQFRYNTGNWSDNTVEAALITITVYK